MCQNHPQARRDLAYPDAEAARKLAAKSAELSAQLEKRRKEKVDQGVSSLRTSGRWAQHTLRNDMSCRGTSQILPLLLLTSSGSQT